jgi:hypothetical protein
MGQQDVKIKLDQLGLVSAGGSSEDFSKFMQSEASRLQMLLKTKRVSMLN